MGFVCGVGVGDGMCVWIGGLVGGWVGGVCVWGQRGKWVEISCRLTCVCDNSCCR